MKPNEGPLTPLGAREALVTAHRDGEAGNRADWLAEEVPVALVFNGVSHAVMLASPLDLEDFALGFGLTEGLLAHPGELFGTEAVETREGIELLRECHGLNIVAIDFNTVSPPQDVAEQSAFLCAHMVMEAMLLLARRVQM